MEGFYFYSNEQSNEELMEKIRAVYGKVHEVKYKKEPTLTIITDTRVEHNFFNQVEAEDIEFEMI